jgi:hypothetical protein
MVENNEIIWRSRTEELPLCSLVLPLLADVRADANQATNTTTLRACHDQLVVRVQTDLAVEQNSHRHPRHRASLAHSIRASFASFHAGDRATSRTIGRTADTGTATSRTTRNAMCSIHEKRNLERIDLSSMGAPAKSGPRSVNTCVRCGNA